MILVLWRFGQRALAHEDNLGPDRLYLDRLLLQDLLVESPMAQLSACSMGTNMSEPPRKNCAACDGNMRVARFFGLTTIISSAQAGGASTDSASAIRPICRFIIYPIVVDAHIEVDCTIPVEAGYDIAVAARHSVMERHRVLSLMTHIDPWRRPDLEHAIEPARTAPAAGSVGDSIYLPTQASKHHEKQRRNERTIRILVGLGLIGATLFGAIGPWGWIGLIPLATGIFRFCPAYLPFGMRTCRSK